jgi:hypothetical protein
MNRSILAVAVWLTASLAALAQAPAATPSVTITLGARQGQAVPVRQGFTHTGGGNIDVAQPAPDTVVVTMTGVAVAGGHPCRNSTAALTYDLSQVFEIAFEKPDVKRAKLTIEGRVIGLLRSHEKGGGSAQEGPATASVSSGETVLATVTLPAHAVAGGENLSVNNHDRPIGVSVAAGKYTLHQSWSVSASHPKRLKLCKAASAELAPDPALDPLWISYWEPFHGAAKKDFGFQMTIRVSAE